MWGDKWEGPQFPLPWSCYGEGEGSRESDDDWKQLHNHSILLMLESRRIFSFNSLKWRAPLLALKCKQEAFNVHFSQKRNAGCSYWSKTLLLVFVLFGICKFCDDSNIGLFMCSLRVAVSGIIILSCKQKWRRMFRESLPEPSFSLCTYKKEHENLRHISQSLQFIPSSWNSVLWVWYFKQKCTLFEWCR